MNRLKVIVGILLIFTVGVLAGAIGTRVVVKHRVEKFLQSPDPPGMKVLSRLSHRLDLSDAQEETIRDFLEQTREKWVSLRGKYKPEFQELIQDTLAKIKGELNESQVKKLDRISDRFKRRRGFSAGRGPFQGPPGHAMSDESMSEIISQLQLNDTQQEEVKSILADAEKARQAIAGKIRRQRRQTRQRIRREMSAHQADVEKQLRPILTPEQLDTYRRMADSRSPIPPPPPIVFD